MNIENAAKEVVDGLLKQAPIEILCNYSYNTVDEFICVKENNCKLFPKYDNIGLSSIDIHRYFSKHLDYDDLLDFLLFDSRVSRKVSELLNNLYEKEKKKIELKKKSWKYSHPSLLLEF